MLSIGDIKRHSFTPQKGGRFYDCSEVDSFFSDVTQTLDAVTGAYEKAKRDNEELINKIKVLSNKIEEYRSDEDNLRSALLIAQRAADSVMKEAKEEAEKIVGAANEEAQTKIDSIKCETDSYVSEKKAQADEYLEKAEKEYDETVSKAKADASEILSKANKEADDILLNAKSEAAKIKDNAEKTVAAAQTKLSSIKKITSEFKSSVIDVMTQQIRLLESIEIDGEIAFDEVQDEVYHPEYTSEEYNSDSESEAEEETAEEAIVEEDEIIEEEETVDVDASSEDEEIEEIIEIEEDEEPQEAETEETSSEVTETKEAEEDFEEIEEISIDDEFEVKENDPSPSGGETADGKDYFDTLMESLSAEEEKKPAKNVFTPIIDSESQVYKREEADKNLKFGKDYDIFGEDDDEYQGSFFGRFKKK